MIYVKYTNETEGFKLWSTKFHGFITVPLSLVGVIFNILTIAIFSRKSMRSLTNNILLGISVFDILLMVAYIPYAFYFYLLGSPDPIPGQYAFWPFFALMNSHLSLFAHGCSVWFACFLALYRYLTVTSCVSRSSYNPKFNSNKIRNIMIGIVMMVLACMTFNVLCYGLQKSCFQFIEIDNGKNNNTNNFNYELCNENLNENITYYSSSNSSKNNEITSFKQINNKNNKIVSLNLLWIQDSEIARMYPVILSINFWIHAIVLRTVPCLLLLVLSGLLIYVMRIANLNRMKLMQQGRRSEYEKAGEFNRTTTMLLIVVISFLIMELPHGILYIICSISQSFFHEVYVKLGDLLDLLVLINSSINFFLYCCMSSQFRDKFKQMFCSIIFKTKSINPLYKNTNHNINNKNSVNLKRFSSKNDHDYNSNKKKKKKNNDSMCYIFSMKKNRHGSVIFKENNDKDYELNMINEVRNDKSNGTSNVNANNHVIDDLDKTPFIKN